MVESVLPPNDRHVVRSLFLAFCTSIPEDVRQDILRSSPMEMKCLIAIQPRVSSFSHRQRHSLRHPALSIASKRFFYHRRIAQAKWESIHGDTEIVAADGATQAQAAASSVCRSSNGGMESHWDTFWLSVSNFSNRFFHKYRSPTRPTGTRFLTRGLPKVAGEPSRGEDVLDPLTLSQTVLSDSNAYSDIDSSCPGSIVLNSFALSQRSRTWGRLTAGEAPLVSGQEDAGCVHDMDEGERFRHQEFESKRWGHIAQCYDQLLRAASSSCTAAARSAAVDGRVNDIICRFWVRLTSPAAEETPTLSGETALQPDAASGSDDDRQLISPTGSSCSEGASGAMSASEAKSSKSTRRDPSAGGDSALPNTGRVQSPSQKSKQSISEPRVGRSRRRSISVSARPQASRQKWHHQEEKGLSYRRRKPVGRQGGGKLGSGRRKTVSTGTGGRRPRSSPSGSLRPAPYMTSLQYIYLNTRIAKVLLPQSDELDLEMLESVQEDLVIDAMYREDNTLQVSGFGNCPRRTTDTDTSHHAHLLADEGWQRSTSNSILHRRSSYRTRGDDDYSSYSADKGHSPTEGDLNSVAAKRMEPQFVGVSPMTFEQHLWRPTMLPSLTFPQFWRSMMELADNWCTSAANPVEFAVFLMELYCEVFGHDWDDDEALVAGLRSTLDEIAAQHAEVSSDTLESFHDLLNVFDSYSGSESDVSDLLYHLEGALYAGERNTRGCRRRRPGKQKRNGKSSEEDRGIWTYYKVVDADGTVHHMRRRKGYVASRKHRPVVAAVGEGEGDACSDSVSGGGRSDSEEYSVYIIEEELNEKGVLIRRRRLRRRRSGSAVARRRHNRNCRPGERRGSVQRRASRHAEHSSSSFTTARRGKMGYFSDEEDGSLSDSTESAYSTSGRSTSRRRPSHRRRRRVGRDGQRATRRRNPSDFNTGDSYRSDDALSSQGDSSSLFMYSSFDDDMLSFVDELGVYHPGEVRMSAGEVVHVAKLTQRQRDELLKKKSWLQARMAQRGVTLADDLFENVNEYALLWRLLQMTERLERKALRGDASEGDDVGTAVFDRALLAKIFEEAEVFSLEALQNSELLRGLLSDDTAGSDVQLSPEQMENLLAALKQRGTGRVLEKPSVLLRRERLIQELQRKKNQAEQITLKPTPPTKESHTHVPTVKESTEIFSMTGVTAKLPGHESHSEDRKDGRPRSPPMEDRDQLHTPPMLTTRLQTPSATHPRRPYHSFDDHSAFSVVLEVTSPRAEQERLFREFEAYCVLQASMESDCKVTFKQYTTEQLEAFYSHLHLGPQQQALLRGRAPLAPASSLVGGNLHQLPSLHKSVPKEIGFRFGAGGRAERIGGTGVSGRPQQHTAPVKLFTLTAQPSVETALKESYNSYYDDKAYQDSIFRSERPNGRHRRLRAVPSQSPSTGSRPLGRHPN